MAHEKLENQSEQAEQAEQPEDGSRDVLEFLKESKPTKETRETSPEQVGLIDSLKVKVDEYKTKLEAGGTNEDAIQELTTDYALELKRAQQDPRPYVDMGNRTFANGRLNEELTEVIPDDRELTMEDFDRVFRLDHDLDEFKTVNDYYGHKAGDEILRTYSDILKSGDSVQWLKNCGALVERGEKDPQAFEASVEGGEEFGGMIVFKEEFGPVKLEDGTETQDKEEIINEFIRRIQAETSQKFKDVLTQKDESGELVFKIDEDKKRVLKEKQGIDLPEDFVIESGTSFGYASAKEALEDVVVSEDDNFDAVLQKIRAQMYEKSDKRTYADKLERKTQREESEDENTRLTAEISPRGRAEMLERQNEEVREELRKTREMLDVANNTIIEITGQVADLKASIESIRDTASFDIIAPTLKVTIESMEKSIEQNQKKTAELLQS